MGKNQFDLSVEVLRRLSKAGVLKDVVLIGSWCLPFYRDYFSGIRYAAALRTRDIDFLVPHPQTIKVKTDIPRLLRDLGFIIGYRGTKGYIVLEHPDLIVEFLTPERGKGVDKPVSLPNLGINATALRFLDLLSDNVIKVRVEDFEVFLPHPVNFALHKLIISQRRSKEDKAAKDHDAAIAVLHALIRKGEADAVRRIFASLHLKWRRKIEKGLEEAKEREILQLLSGK